MRDNIQSVLEFNGYFIDEIILTRNQSFNKESVKLELDFCSSVSVKENEGFISLNVTIFKNAKEKGYPFELFINMTGQFHKSCHDLDESKFKKMLEVNGVAILFPFLRSAIADATKIANVPTLLIPALNIVELLKKNT